MKLPPGKNRKEPSCHEIIGSWIPKVDVSEKKNHVCVKINLPSVDPKKVELEVGDSMLVVRGEVEEQKEEKGETWYRVEREIGHFCRRIPLPCEVDRDKLKAGERPWQFDASLGEKVSQAKEED